MDDAQALAELKRVDAQVNGGNRYDDETYQKMLPHFKLYLETREQLRALDLTEVRMVQVMAAGGAR